MRVTFDSNTYRLVIHPACYANDPAYKSAVTIHQALTDGRVTGLEGP